MRTTSKNMAGEKKETEERSAKSLIWSLCEAIVIQEELEEEETWNTNILKLPGYLKADPFRNKSCVKKHLFKTCYDLLLLRRSEWFGRWTSPLSPDCCCLAYAYHLRQNGQTAKADRLMYLVDEEMTTSPWEHTSSVLTFLSILSRSEINSTDPNTVATPNTYVYTVYPDDAFEAIPGTSLQYESDKFLSLPPGTGLMGFCSQNDLQGNLHSSTSSLFGGLTHTTTPTLNTSLHIPSLSNQPPPDMLDRYLKGYSTPKKLPKKPYCDFSVLEDSAIELIDKVGIISEATPTAWEGAMEDISRPYLSESGSEGFRHSETAFLALTTQTVTGTERVRFPVVPGKLDSVMCVMDTLRRCEEKEDRLNNIKFRDGVTRNLYTGVRCIIHVCRVQLDQLLSAKGCTELEIQLHGKQLRRLIVWAEKFLKLCAPTTNGLTVLNSLYAQCVGSGGLPSYQMMLGLFRQSIKPYLSALEMWVYEGQCIKHMNSLGVEVNNITLEARDHTYWSKGFSLTEDNVPQCIASVAGDILSTGRSLNLLNLICPKHHLCSGHSRTPGITFAQSLQELTDNVELFSQYKSSMEIMELSYRAQRKAEMHEEELAKMAPHVLARRKAQKFVNDIKQEEIEREFITREKKQMLLSQQKEEVERVRAYRIEMAALEAEMVSELDDRSDAWKIKEEQLKAEAKADLIDYYQQLGKEAEKRMERAKWRARRFALATARIQQGLDLEDEEGLEGSNEHVVAGSGDIVNGSLDIVNGFQDIVNGSLDIVNGSQDIVNRSQDIVNGSQDIVNGSQDIVNGSQDIVNGSQDIVTGSDDICASNSATVSPNDPIVLDDTQDNPVQDSIIVKPHSSQSVVQDVLYGGDIKASQHITTRGEAPLSTIQQLMYPEEETTDENDKNKDSVIAEEEKEKEEEIEDGKGRDSLTLSLGSSATEESSVIEDKRSDDITRPLVSEVESPLADGIINTVGSCDKGSSDDTQTLPYSRFDVDMELCSAVPFCGMANATPTSTDPPILLTSLDTLIDQCIVHPITIQCSLVNTALIEHFVNDLKVKQHFTYLKDCLFLEDGEFTDTLSSILFEKLMHCSSASEICSASFLQPLLTSAIERTHFRDSVLNFELTAKYRPKALLMTSVNALDFLKLDYKVGWPLNIVIQQDHITDYNKVFHLMLEIKRCSWMLKTVFLKFTKGCYKGQSAISSSKRRLIHAQRQELQHFVTVMEGYISNQIFHLSWREFESKLEVLSSLEQLIMVHNEYLYKTIFKCLLVKKTQSVLNLIEECLACVIKFCCPFLLAEKFKWRTLSNIHKKFHEISSLLFKVITKLVQRGYQPHLEDLLLRMNFNKFYKQK